MFCLPASPHSICMQCWQDQKRASDSMELKVQMVVSCYMDAENQTQVLKSSQCPSLLSRLSNTNLLFLMKQMGSQTSSEKQCLQSNLPFLALGNLSFSTLDPDMKLDTLTGVWGKQSLCGV